MIFRCGLMCVLRFSYISVCRHNVYQHALYYYIVIDVVELGSTALLPILTIFRHDISPVFTGIPVFLSCQRSFLWKSQNRFKNLGDFYGGGGVYLLGDLSDWPSFVSIEYLVTMFYQPIAYVLTVHPLSLTITLIVLRYHKITVLSMSHSHRITKLCREDSFLP